MRVLISGLFVLAVASGRADSQSPIHEPKPVSSFPSGSGSTGEVKRTTGPTIESASVGVRPAASITAAVSEQRRSARRSGTSHDVVLMVVGGAAMVAGAAIGGDAGAIFMVGGAVIGLWGLYNFLQ